MYLTTPQSSHFDASRYRGLAADRNHFDWDLYYRYKDERDVFWAEQLGANVEFTRAAEQHVADFAASIERTRALLRAVVRPRVLDIGLSSEKLDGALIDALGARLTVIDVQSAAADYLSVADPEARFVVGDVLELAADTQYAACYDLVYSIGLVEHFPDKSRIVPAHRDLAAIGGLVLIYAPIDTPLNRRLMAMTPEFENFGYRELLTPDELAQACACPGLAPLAVASVGLFAALWARRTA